MFGVFRLLPLWWVLDTMSFFVDDYSRYTWLILMHKRSELPQLYIDFGNMVKTQFSRSIKLFRADNAAEYTDSRVLDFLRQHGTLPHRSCPGTSQQNGRAERKHRHILNTVRSLLISASCPERFWGEAALTAIYTMNRVPSLTSKNLSPYECLGSTDTSRRVTCPVSCRVRHTDTTLRGHFIWRV